MATMSPSTHVVVIGAGVIGLTTATLLAESGYKVTIIAAHVPGDRSIEYTSPWAGAHFRTHATRSSEKERELCDWDIQTYNFWEKLASSEEGGVAGVKMQESLHFWDGEIVEDLWWAPFVRGFEMLSGFGEVMKSINDGVKEGRGVEVKWGATSRAPSLDVDAYLLYLQERARKSGAVLFQSRLPTDGGLGKALRAAEGIADVALKRGKVDCFVNCTGLGARALCGDEGMFPIRGQTVLVKGEAKATRTRYHGGLIGEGSSSYCIPRPGSGTTILGGTKQKRDWRGEVDNETTELILERCSWMVPELLTGQDGGFEVISAQAGLRPGREGGPRVEKEVVGGRKVVHAYGHAGAGYQNSIGCARKVLKLVEMSVGGQIRGDITAKL